MEKKEFLGKLEKNKGKGLVIETQEGIIQKITIQNSIYEIIEDQLYIKNNINKDYAVINLNIIREIQQINNEILLYIDDKNETKIKISAI